MTLSCDLSTLTHADAFQDRHIGISESEIAAMLNTIGAPSLEALIETTVPASIRRLPLKLEPAKTETEALKALAQMASKNTIQKSCIGLGYTHTITPKVILRNLFENPGWYTAYTPYQAEIAQGRLEALLTFQQMVIDLTGLSIANASLLDEATAAAEAMAMARRISTVSSSRFFVDTGCFPQTIDVLKTRAALFGFELVFGSPQEAQQHDVFGALFQNPNEKGEVRDLSTEIAATQAKGAIVAMATDLMALILIQSPGAMGADIAFGSSQRFGVPMGFGGPHAAFFATRDEYRRTIPGRIIGVSIDARGKRALRMSLQTREQHIRREKANSNICTSQVLLANIAAMYAVYHGPKRLQQIASRIHRLTAILAKSLTQHGIVLATQHFFDTLYISLGERTHTVYAAARQAGYTLRKITENNALTSLGITLDESTTPEDVVTLASLITGSRPDIAALDSALCQDDASLPQHLCRQDKILQAPVFNLYHTEHEMLRYLKRLQNKDLALDHSMIPLGSCTMKLTATAEMIPLSWPAFSEMHPFAPIEDAAGYLEMIKSLDGWLREITGFDAICFQPNSGAQGEYAGIVAITRYHQARGEGYRNICLIPQSAHGTNPATAQMCGLSIVAVKCDDAGNVDVDDLKEKAKMHADHLSCIMITYPSTHGVFEEGIREICDTIHRYGGQVYMDGANLNAQVGLTAPGIIGADVSHMNLHKTFAIPHGGGGPGMGPIGVKAHLIPFLPDHVVQATGEADRLNKGQHAVSAAPWGSASILTISWMYIAMLGAKGLTQATQIAILNANYIACELSNDYPVLYTGAHGRVAHECILDIRPLKESTGITEGDIAKRLMDYGFHAPTVSFPVAGTLMIEPTESESKSELDRFIAAMRSIRAEIRLVDEKKLPRDNNPLKNAPHTQSDLMGEWNRPYSREMAVFPLPWVAQNKFWPSVNRIDDVYGDRNFCCTVQF